MNILFITAFPPNTKTAGQDYTRRLLNDLVTKHHAVSLIYFTYPGHSIGISEGVNVLKSISPSVKNLLNASEYFPFFSKRFDKSLLKFINSIKDSFDILYFDFSQVHLYSLYVEHPCKILMCHDVIFQKAQRQFPVLLPWIRWCEQTLLKTGDYIITFSKKDSNLIHNQYGLTSYPVNFYLKENDFSSVQDNNYSEVLKDTFCFYGAWNRKENLDGLLWFIKKVIPLVKQQFHFKVIGSGMSEKTTNYIKRVPGFEYVGFVENPMTEIMNCSALIAPLHKGAGVKVKVIDALSSGTKVIGTPVAFEGIEDNGNYPLFVQCTFATDFATVINNWNSNSVGDKANARAEFLERYDTNHFPDLIEKLLPKSY